MTTAGPSDVRYAGFWVAAANVTKMDILNVREHPPRLLWPLLRGQPRPLNPRLARGPHPLASAPRPPQATLIKSQSQVRGHVQGYAARFCRIPAVPLQPPRGPADPRQHPPLPPGRPDPLTDRHPPSLPATFRKLNAVAVLTGPSLPAPRHAVTARGGDGAARPVNREPQLLASLTGREWLESPAFRLGRMSNSETLSRLLAGPRT